MIPSCIIAPSPSALGKLLDICADFAISNFILFNEKKTKGMCFKSNSLNGLFVPTVCLIDDVPYAKSLYSRGNMLISRFKPCSSSIKVKSFRSFLCNAYGCYLWSTYKQYTHKRTEKYLVF